MNKIIWALLVFGILAVAGVGFGLYALDSSDNSRLGQRGDFFGGFLNPILTFLGFIGVLITVYMQKNSSESQRKESIEQLNALRRQSFENALFQMLMLHNSIVDSINVTKKIHSIGVFGGAQKALGFETLTLHGRDAFEKIFDDMHITTTKSIEKSDDDSEKNAKFNEGYARFWKRYRQDLGHYYRTLYNIVRFIDESEFCNNRTYIRLVRAQLSDYELSALMYNCISSNGLKFKFYVEKYKLLDNLAEDIILSDFVVQRFNPNAFGK